jgi:two-component system cell cycle sensor histidine kinase/response regulator CckA
VNTQGYGTPGRYAMLSVADTGADMDAKTREHIFEPFFTTKEVGRGTGLGLSTAYGIVKQHNGFITVSSEPKKGATFRIYLPLSAGHREQAAAKHEVRGGTETILIAEDDPAVMKFTGEMLRAYGYSVIEATDGQDAVDMFVKNKDRTNLVIVDVVMPRKSGKEAYEDIKKVRPDTKVIFASGYTRDVIIDKGIYGDKVDFISKPLSAPDLLKKVREVLDK